MLDYYLPSSQNWYCSKIIDVSKNGILAYGAKNSVILMKLLLESSSNDRMNVAYYGVINVNKNRVTGVEFCHLSNSENLLGFIGEDCLVHVIDVNSKEVIYKHESHTAKISCITWSSANEFASSVISGDESGRLLVANIASKHIKEYKPYQAAIKCLSSCRASTNLVAIGYGDGRILVIDTANRGEIVFNVKQHNDEVISICWAPFIGPGIFENDLKNLDDNQKTYDCNYLFVSSSRDKNIKIWSVFQQICLRSLLIPTNVGSCHSRKSGDVKNTSWITVKWPEFNHDILLSGCLSGCILTWNLHRNKKSWSVIGKEETHHSRSIHNIAFYENVTVTVSVDRTIKFWCMTETMSTCQLSLPTLGGAVHDLAFSPISSGILAVGCADAAIRVWNIASPDNSFNVGLFWQGLNKKVTTLAWHPTKEGLLAFGTEDGRVGLYNVLTTKPPSFSNGNHFKGNKVVYTVCWGPISPTGGSTDNLGVYSCSGSSAIMHYVPFENGAVNLNKLLQEANPTAKNSSRWTEIAFKPDYSILCLGSEKSCIELYDVTDLQLLFVLPGSKEKNYIHSIKWHPKYVYSINSPSKYQHVLSVATKSPIVFIYDLSEYLDENSPQCYKNMNRENLPVLIPQCQYQLWEHKESIASLSWNPHFEGQLVTASFDNSCCVWNVFERKVMACYIDHKARVLCAEWNPSDPNVIFSGGEDQMIHAWKISEQPEKFIGRENACQKSLKTKPIEPKPVKPESSNNNGHNEDSEHVSDYIEELLSKKRMELLLTENVDKESMFSVTGEFPSNGIEISAQKASVATDKNSIADDDEVGELPTSQELLQNVTDTTTRCGSAKKKKKKRDEKSLFPITSRLESASKESVLRDCIVLTDRLVGINTESVNFGVGEAVNLGFYGDCKDTSKLLNSEANYHIENSNLESALQLEIWKGNIKGALETAAKCEQLTDSLIALASTVSPQFWSEMCSLYVRQLIATKMPHKAVLFLLANRKIHEAIDVLKTHVSYKEAIILAKCRLRPRDPLISQLVEECAEQWLQRDRNDCAAKYYLSIGKSEMAANVLSRKHDASSVKVSAYIASKTESSQADSYIKQCITDSLISRNFEIASDAIIKYPSIKPFKVVVEIHKRVSNNLWKMPLSHTIVRENLVVVASEEIRNDERGENLGEYYSSCRTLFESCHVMSGPANDNELDLWISLNFVLTALDILQKDYERAVNRILDIFIEAKFKSSYLIPLACSFVNLYQFSSCVATNNLRNLLGINDGLLPENKTFYWWNSILSFLCFAKLDAMLNANQLNDERQKTFVNEEDAQFISDVILDENRAKLSMLKRRLQYTAIAITVLATTGKNINESKEQLTEESDDVSDVAIDDRANATAFVDRVKFYDKLLDLSNLTVIELQKEKTSLEEEISKLSTSSMVDKFPDPFESCLILMELCLKNEGTFWKDMFSKTLSFGRKFIVTQRQSQVLDDKQLSYNQKYI